MMPTKPRKNWARDELLVAFNLYCRTPFGKLHQSNPEIISMAKMLGRTPGSVAMKLVNFASLDPVQQARGISGLKNAAVADQTIFSEFDQEWAKLAIESEAAMERLGFGEEASSDEAEKEFQIPTGPTEVLRMVKTRRAQSLFRATVLASYDFACAISGINLPELLQASHIVPWASQEASRLDPRNGLALCTLHDRAFDRGLITLDDDFRVVVSKRLKVRKPTELHRESLLAIEGQKIRMPTRYLPDLNAIEYHRSKIFVA